MRVPQARRWAPIADRSKTALVISARAEIAVRYMVEG